MEEPQTQNPSTTDGAQLLAHGEVYTIKGVSYEVTAISYLLNAQGNKYNFSITLRPKEDVDAEKAAEDARIQTETPTDPNASLDTSEATPTADTISGDVPAADDQTEANEPAA